MADVAEELASLNENAKALLEKYDGAFSKLENLSEEKQKELNDLVSLKLKEIEENAGTVDMEALQKELDEKVKSALDEIDNASDFQQTLETNGFVKLSNGLILQWGYASLPDTDEEININQINFPVSFPNKVLNVQVTSREGTDFDNDGQYFYEIAVSSNRMNVNGFEFRIIDASSGSGDVGINYIAIGF